MNIEETDYFKQTYLELGPADRAAVLGMLLKLESREEGFGKRLRSPLENCRSVRTGVVGQLRIVYRLLHSSAVLLVVGPRENLAVYTKATQVLDELDL